MWATARFDLGLSAAEFESAGIYEYSLLMKRFNANRKFQASLFDKQIEEPVVAEPWHPEAHKAYFKGLAELTKGRAKHKKPKAN